ncbi:hypothetical protein, variant [Sphaeroforma arctica JP610]|nr:hypothetical protein, variant [Sphaeroforma arctica JP610]KNC82423.1 hypothetical protein, variant [Sphaeroforma arctica JP610]|eukprot:XP_014156325.1 hypothetical protein, variant [Sphaeroforma arctica JP610]
MFGTLKRKTKSLTLRKKGKKDEPANSQSDLSGEANSTTNMPDDVHSTHTTTTTNTTTNTNANEQSATDARHTQEPIPISYAAGDTNMTTNSATATDTHSQMAAEATPDSSFYTPSDVSTSAATNPTAYTNAGDPNVNVSMPAPAGVVAAPSEQLDNPFGEYGQMGQDGLTPGMPVDNNNVSGLAFVPEPPVDSQGAPQSALVDDGGSQVVVAANQGSDDSFSDSSDEEEKGKPAIMVKIRPRDEHEQINEDVDYSSFKLDSINSPPSSRARRERNTPQRQQDDTPFDMGEPRWKSEQAMSQTPALSSSSIADSSGSIPAMARSTTTPALFIATADADPDAQLSKAVAMQAALTETSNVYFKGAKVGKSLLAGKLMLSFNQCLERVLEDAERSQPLTLNFSSKVSISQIVMNPAFREASRGTSKLAAGETLTLQVSASDLMATLKKKNPPAQGIQMVGKSYRLTLMTYQSVSQNGTDLVPLLVHTQWDCATNETKVVCDYKINSESVGAPELALSDVKIAVQMAGDKATGCDSQAADAHWDETTQKLEWTIPKLDRSTNTGGTITAHFSVDGKSKRTKTMVRFHANSSIMSGAVLENAAEAPAYFRLRKVIRKTTAGKYISDFTSESADGTGAPVPKLPSARVNSLRKMPLPKEVQGDTPADEQTTPQTVMSKEEESKQPDHTHAGEDPQPPLQEPWMAQPGVVGMDPTAAVAAAAPAPGPFDFISAGISGAYGTLTGDTVDAKSITPNQTGDSGEASATAQSQLADESIIPRKSSVPPSHPPPQRNSQDILGSPPELPPPRKSSRGGVSNPFGDN